MEFKYQLPTDLEAAFDEIRTCEEQIPGAYYIVAEQGEGRFAEYYAVLESASIFPKVNSYGQKLSTSRLYPVSDDRGGWRIVEYELGKCMLQSGETQLTREKLRDIALHAAEYHPEYFGRYPVPVMTPWGYTLRHRELANGICRLETDECREVLSVCEPIWRGELSETARKIGTQLMGYLFFPDQAGCVPVFELSRTRSAWDGALVDRQALMNAIWEYLPQYALAQNHQEQLGWNDLAAALMAELGVEIEPRILGREIIRIFPDKGTDFFLPPPPGAQFSEGFQTTND